MKASMKRTLFYGPGVYVKKHLENPLSISVDIENGAAIMQDLNGILFSKDIASFEEPVLSHLGREKKVHDLKIQPAYFEAVKSELKSFEIRKNDREYNYGDILVLHEYDTEYGYTGKVVNRFICYMSDYEQKPGYVVLGIRPLPKETE